MNISFTQPLSRAWNRMTKELFHPFDINKWFRLGFTAWLAGLSDCHGGGNGNNSVRKNVHWDEFFSFPETAWNWLQSHPLWFNLIILGVILLFIISIVIIWLSCRGKFMFLYNVANKKIEISQPWTEFRKEGNSLFVWRVLLDYLAAILFVLFLIYCFVTAKTLYYGDYPDIVIFRKIAGMILVFLAYIIVVGYFSLFLNDFVVPIMYKHRLGFIQGWSKFLPLLGRHLVHFIVYGLFILVLSIAAVVAIVTFGVFTCCIGFILLIIPYIGAVVLLPVSYTFRALSIEFLAQFGDEFNVFPKTEETGEQLPEVPK